MDLPSSVHAPACLVALRNGALQLKKTTSINHRGRECQREIWEASDVIGKAAMWHSWLLPSNASRLWLLLTTFMGRCDDGKSFQTGWYSCPLQYVFTHIPTLKFFVRTLVTLTRRRPVVSKERGPWMKECGRNVRSFAGWGNAASSKQSSLCSRLGEAAGEPAPHLVSSCVCGT